MSKLLYEALRFLATWLQQPTLIEVAAHSAAIEITRQEIADQKPGKQKSEINHIE